MAQSMSPSSQLLLGDDLQQQLKDEESMRKKKLAAQSRVGPLGPATQSLFSLQGGFNG